VSASPREILEEARSYFRTPVLSYKVNRVRWTKGYYNSDRFDDDRPVRSCSVGALALATLLANGQKIKEAEERNNRSLLTLASTDGNFLTARWYLTQAIWKLFPEHRGDEVERFNDHRDTNFKKVEAVFVEATKMAIEDEEKA
jgi:hypothetical protein